MPENESPEQLRQKLDAKLTGLERLRLAGLVTEERYAVMRDQLIAAAGVSPDVAPPSTAAQPYQPPAPAAPPPPPSAAPPYPPPAAPAMPAHLPPSAPAV